MHRDAVVDDRDDGPWLNDDCEGDGTGRDLLALPAEEEPAAEEARLDGLGGGASRLAKRRNVDRDITCVIQRGRKPTETGKGGGGDVSTFYPDSRKARSASSLDSTSLCHRG